RSGGSSIGRESTGAIPRPRAVGPNRPTHALGATAHRPGNGPGSTAHAGPLPDGAAVPWVGRSGGPVPGRRNRGFGLGPGWPTGLAGNGVLRARTGPGSLVPGLGSREFGCGPGIPGIRTGCRARGRRRGTGVLGSRAGEGRGVRLPRPGALGPTV